MSALDSKSAQKKFTGTCSAGDFPYLPSEVTALGCIPNTGALLPGDLVLTAGGSMVSPVIKAAQESQFPLPHHNEWTHAAIYVEGYDVIEAVPFMGVRRTSMLSWVAKSKLLFRRPAIIHNNLDERDARILGLGVVLNAALRIGNTKYDIRRTFRYLRALVKKNVDHFDQDERYRSGVVCSTLYADCVYQVTKSPLVNVGSIVSSIQITPAALAASTKLVDLDHGWLELTDTK